MSSPHPNTQQAKAEALWRSPPNLKRAYADYTYGQIHYRFTNPPNPGGRPFMLFHQTGSSGRCYEYFTAEMGKDRMAIVVDTPACGASDPVGHPPTIKDFANAMEELIDALDLKEVDLMGDHTGSRTAIEVALRRPKQVRHIVLNAVPIYSKEELESRQNHDQKIHMPGKDGHHVLSRWDNSMQHFGDVSITLGELEFIEGLRPGPFTFHGHNAAFSYPTKENLPKVEQPVLILHAKDDLWEPTARAEPLIRNGKMVPLPQFGREMLMGHYKEVADVVRPFLDIK